MRARPSMYVVFLLFDPVQQIANRIIKARGLTVNMATCEGVQVRSELKSFRSAADSICSHGRPLL